MGDHSRRFKRAFTVPTLKMRVFQVSVFAVCLVAALGAVSAVIIARSARAKDWSNAASGALTLSASFYEGAGLIEKAQLLLLEGKAAEANQAFKEGKKQLEAALSGIAALRKDVVGLVGGDPMGEPFFLAADAASERAPKVISLFYEERSLALGGGGPGVEALHTELDSATRDTLQAATELNNEAQLFVEESSSQSRGVTRLAAIAYPLICGITLLLTAMIMAIIYRGVSRIVLDVIAEVKKIASGKGDLTARVSVPTADVLGDLGDAINEMLDTLHEFMLEMRSISGQLSSAAEALAFSTDATISSIGEADVAAGQIARGSEEQARKVEGTSRAMGEVARSVEGISDRGRVSAGQSELTVELAESGVAASAEAAEVMRDIVESVEDSARLMEGLGERFTQIGIIIDVMTDIADQTNLLALNAAIEAAHAGEHGKGFAVVAGEVRKLAENSKRSAEQISRLIREIMSETNRVVASMAVGNERVEAGLAVAEKSGEVLEGIVDASRTGALAAGEISSAIKAIAANTDQVFASINDMASIARQTAASSQEVTATIREQKISTEDVARSSLGLAELAFQLSELTQGFKL